VAHRCGRRALKQLTSPRNPAALAARTLAALGVVYGDIGTSPLYALKEVFHGGHVPVTHDNILGVLSLIFWTLTIIVSLKYVLLVLRADNNGEGGLIAMLALATSAVKDRPALRQVLMTVGLFGTAGRLLLRWSLPHLLCLARFYRGMRRRPDRCTRCSSSWAFRWWRPQCSRSRCPVPACRDRHTGEWWPSGQGRFCSLQGCSSCSGMPISPDRSYRWLQRSGFSRQRATASCEDVARGRRSSA
jgi:hypothetical protein